MRVCVCVCACVVCVCMCVCVIVGVTVGVSVFLLPGNSTRSRQCSESAEKARGQATRSQAAAFRKGKLVNVRVHTYYVCSLCVCPQKVKWYCMYSTCITCDSQCTVYCMHVIWTCTHTCVYTHIHIHSHTYVRTYTHTHICTLTYVHTYTLTHIIICLHLRTYALTYTVYTHT